MPSCSHLMHCQPMDLPDHWRSQLEGSEWVLQTNGESGAAVFRIETPGKPTLYLKSENAGPFEEIPAEAARLRWLTAMGIPCPTVQRAETCDGRNWLLMTAVPGADCESLGPRQAETIVACTANALRQLHSIDIKSCPFDQTLAKRIADARNRVLAGAVDEANFDDEHVGIAASDLLERLTASRPESEDLVVAHGDACLPNIMIDGEEFSGFVDCGRLGVADRYQDLALASRNIASDLGAEWVAPLFRGYGIAAPNLSKLTFYRLLDEFF